jgi:membrane carboxypeptidase/penicillin-binding protein
MKKPSRLRRFTEAHPKLVRSVLLALTFGVAFGGGIAYSSWILVCRDGRCPPIQILDTYTPRQTSKVYAADDRFVSEIGLERRTLVKIAEIPKVVRDAFVLTEDKRFYRHSGIDWIRVPGAALKHKMPANPRIRLTGRLEYASMICLAYGGRCGRTGCNRVKK